MPRRCRLSMFFRRRGDLSAEITVLTMDGLTLTEARPGDHAAISVPYPTGVTAWTSEAWGINVYGDETFGFAANPLDYTASDGELLRWRGIGDNGLIYRASAEIRYAAGTAPVIADQTWTVDTAVSVSGAASGTGLVFTYSATGLPSGVAISASTGLISGTPTAVSTGTVVVTATDQYGRALTDSFAFTAALPALGTFTTQPSIQGPEGVLKVGLALEVDDGAFSTTATLAVTSFTLDGIDKRTELVLDEFGDYSWDTTGENVYAASGTISVRVRATDAYNRTVDSNIVTATLKDVPQQPGTGTWSLADNGDGTFDIVLSSLTDDGNEALTGYQYTTDAGTTWLSLPSYAGVGTYVIAVASDGTTPITTTGYTVQIRAVNAAGNGTAAASKAVTVTGAVSPASITVVTAGSYSSGQIPITIQSADATDDADTVYWVAVPTGQTAPNATQVKAGLNYLDAAPLDAGSFTWNDDATTAQPLASGISRQDVDVHVAIDNGALSNVSSTTDEIDTLAPVLSGAIGTPTGATTATWAVTSDEASGTIYAGIRPSASAALTAAQLIAGSGGAGVAFGSDATVTANGSNGGSFTGLTASTNYVVDTVQVDSYANQSAVVSSATLTTAGAGDVTAPVLSSPTDTVNGSTASTGTVSTDEGNGTLYWVVTTSATSPSAAQVKAGNDHTGSAATADGSQAVSASGVQNISATGLTASTAYFTHYMHEDAAANQSTVSSADGFTTAAPSGWTDSFAYTNGTILSATAAWSEVSSNGAGNLIVTDGNVQMNATNSTRVVTRTDDVGSDNVYLEIDVTTLVGLLNVTRLEIFCGDVEFRISTRGSTTIRRTSTNTQLTGGSHTTPLTASTIRLEMNRTTQQAYIYVDGVARSGPADISFETGTLDRTFDVGVRISDQDDGTQIVIHEIRSDQI